MCYNITLHLTVLYLNNHTHNISKIYHKLYYNKYKFTEKHRPFQFLDVYFFLLYNIGVLFMLWMILSPTTNTSHSLPICDTIPCSKLFRTIKPTVAVTLGLEVLLPTLHNVAPMLTDIVQYDQYCFKKTYYTCA